MRRPGGWYHAPGTTKGGGHTIAPAHWVGEPDEDGSHALCGAQPHKDYFGKMVTPESWAAAGMRGELRYCQHCSKAMKKHLDGITYHPRLVWKNGADATPFLTQEQIDAVNRLAHRHETLREVVTLLSGIDGVVFVQAGNILLGVERDGYTHS